MKKQLFSIMVIGICMIPLLSFNLKHHHKKAVDQYYFVFYTGGGTYEINGRGGEFSGTITSAYEACAGGLKIGGTASGTYSYNTTTDVMSIDATDTPTGSTEVEYSGTIASGDYDSSPISIGCNP